MNAQIDPLIIARARIADLELGLAQARHIVRGASIDPGSSEQYKDLARNTLAEIDRRLDGTIFSYARDGATR
jgi:hypothetical protein